MSDEARRLRTEGQAERFYLARRRGGLCAACGRELKDGEPVYVEQFDDFRGSWVNRPMAPVGAECASDELRHAAASREPEPCAGCGRPMYYGVQNSWRKQALCSHSCRYRAGKHRQDGG